MKATDRSLRVAGHAPSGKVDSLRVGDGSPRASVHSQRADVDSKRVNGHSKRVIVDSSRVAVCVLSDDFTASCRVFAVSTLNGCQRGVPPIWQLSPPPACSYGRNAGPSHPAPHPGPGPCRPSSRTDRRSAPPCRHRCPPPASCPRQAR